MNHVRVLGKTQLCEDEIILQPAIPQKAQQTNKTNAKTNRKQQYEQINTSESEPCSYEATKAVAKKASDFFLCICKTHIIYTSKINNKTRHNISQFIDTKYHE